MTNFEDDDSDLVRRANSGERDAHEQLVQRHERVLRGFIDSGDFRRAIDLS